MGGAASFTVIGRDYRTRVAYCRAVEVDAVADLRWLLLAPALLASDTEYPCDHVGFDGAQRVAIEQWLASVAREPQALYAFLERARPAREVPMRLGRYAERLLAFYLTHGPLHAMVAANLAVLHPPGEHRGANGDHTTKGEIDFLLTGPDGERLHWELALKYFVARDLPAPTIDDYLGPDSSESFRIKVEKLVCRQVVQAPPPPYDDHAWTPQLFTRGQMFYRFGREATACAVLNPAHQRGFWVPFGALDELATLPPAHAFVRLPRAQWMAPRVHAEAMALAPLREAIARSWRDAATRRPGTPPVGIMVAEVAPGVDGAGWREVARGFVMPESFDHGHGRGHRPRAG